MSREWLGHRLVSRPSEYPKVQSATEDNLEIFIPNGLQFAPVGRVEVTPTIEHTGYVSVGGVKVKPWVNQPLFSSREVTRGGTRVIGGGTSEKTLRRQKKKIGKENAA